jgi:hypothetical protein
MQRRERDVPVALPLSVDMQQREMVALRDEELLPRRVTLLLAFPRPIKDGRDGEHRDDGKHLGAALVVDGDDEHLGEGGLHRVVGHFSTERGEVTDVVERAKDPKLVHGVDDVFL